MKKELLKITSGALLCVTAVTYTIPTFAYTKEETVFSKINTNGEVYKTIVNNHLKNSESEEVLNDISDLINIENVNGDEIFEKENNKLIWKANGNDIYYQGETEKQLPISLKIKYELDGKEINANEIAGKKGKVKITIDYTNKDSHLININGKQETLYTPFVVVCGTIFENSKIKNVTVSNGKVVDNGEKTIVIGYAVPGLQQSLGLSKKDIDLPSSIEISMDAKEFETKNIMNYVTPKIIEEKDISAFDKLDELFGKVNTLKNAADRIEEGANELKEGTITYSEKSKEFNNAMEQVADGISNVNNSYTQIDNAISLLNRNSSTLQSGAKTISDGTEAVSENLKLIAEKLEELENGSVDLHQGEKQVENGIDQIISKLSTIQVTDNSKKIEELTTLYKTNEQTINTLKTTNKTLEAQSQKEGILAETKASFLKQIEGNKSLITLLENNNKATNETINTLKQTNSSSLIELQEGLKNLKAGITQVEAGTKKLEEGTRGIKTGTNTLAGKAEELSEGAKKLYDGTEKISSGTKSLNAGSNTIKTGINTLDNSTGLLAEANNKLTEGANSLSEGATTLAEGITKFNKEGIQVLYNYVNKDAKETKMRLEKLQELSENYTHFTMIDNGTEGITKFIIIIDSIKKTENVQENAVLPNVDVKVKTEKEDK